MGTTSSTLSLSVVVAGTAAYVCYRYVGATGSKPALQPPSKRDAPPSKLSKKKSKGDKQQSESEASPLVVPFPAATTTSIPGAFEPSDAASVAPKAKKPKKKKAKKAGTGATSAEATSEADSVAPTPTQKGKKKGGAASGATASSGAPDHEQWTRVEARRKPKAANDESASETKDKARPTVKTTPADLTTSDAGITTSVTGTGTGSSSPVTERTTDEEPTEALDVATPGADGLKVKPAPGEEPVKGYSWDDYEGVDADADGEGDWGVVSSKKARRTPATNEWTTVPTRSRTQSAAKEDASEPSKKQRQNAAKRDALKAGKADAEAQRLATLARHKRELERVRMEQMI